MSFVQKNLKKISSKEEKVERDSLFSTCAYINKKIFAFTSFKRLPIVIDLKSKEIDLLENIQEYDSTFMADFMINDGDDIYVLELNGNRIMKYNVVNRKCKYFDISCGKREWDNFATFAKCGENIYIFPLYINEIIKVNFETGKIHRDKGLYLDLRNYVEQEQEIKYFYCGCKVGKIMWLFQRQGNLVVAYNMENDTWKKYKLSVKINNCVHVVRHNGMMYILSGEGLVYCWNMTDDPVELIADCSNEEANFNTFIRIAVTDKKIFLLPSLGEDIVIIDLNIKQISKYEDYPIEFKYYRPEGWSRYYGYCEDDDNYYFAMRSMNFMLSINKRYGNEKWIKFKLPLHERFVKQYINCNRNMLGEAEVTLETLFTYIYKNYKKNLKQNDISRGKWIWKRINVD